SDVTGATHAFRNELRVVRADLRDRHRESTAELGAARPAIEPREAPLRLVIAGAHVHDAAENSDCELAIAARGGNVGARRQRVGIEWILFRPFFRDAGSALDVAAQEIERVE